MIIPDIELDENITKVYDLTVRLEFEVTLQEILTDAELNFEGYRVTIDGSENYEIYLYNMSSGLRSFDINHYGQAMEIRMIKAEVFIPRLLGAFENIEITPLFKGIGVVMAGGMSFLSYKVVATYGAKKIQTATDNKF